MAIEFDRQYDIGPGLTFLENTGILSGSDDPTVTDISGGANNIPDSTLYLRHGATPQIYVKNGTGALDWDLIYPSVLGPQDTFDAYFTTGSVVINSGWTDVPLDVQRQITTATFTHTASDPNVTIDRAGDYLVIGRVATENTGGGSRSESEVRLVLDTGSGFTQVDGTLGTIYNRNSSQGTTTATVQAVLSLSVGDEVKLQAQRSSGGNTVELVNDACALTLISLQGVRGVTGDQGPPGDNVIDIEQDDSSVATDVGTLNFEGYISVTDDGGGKATVDIPGFNVEEDDTSIATDLDTLNFSPLFSVTDDGGGQATVDIVPKNILNRHNGGVTQTLTGSFVTALFDTSIREDTDYSYSSGEITINKDGWFRIQFDISIEHGGGGQESAADGVVQLNGSDITGSDFYLTTLRDSDGSTTSSSVIVEITSGDVVRVRIRANERNPSTIEDSCRIYIEEVDSP